MPASLKYLDPKVLNKIGRMELKARLIVEGFISGLHKSPYRGFSVEFAQHREYAWGDELRHVDWKVWGKTDRFYVKQYEQETNLACAILLDASESMAYGSPQAGLSKFEYGCYIAASLSYLLINQADAAGLALYDAAVRRWIPPAGHPTQLIDIARTLESVKPGVKSNMEPVFTELAGKLRRRGIVAVISDLFNPVESLLRGLKAFRHRRHDVVVFHLLDPYERSFPFQRITLFEGLEEWPDLPAEPRSLRDGYLEALAGFERSVRGGCARAGIEYIPLTTDQRLDAALAAFLSRRSTHK
jgi:uncharacterized protein (DUF58 family)